ncbi:MAG: phosphoribosylamine--glycine ligase [Clostridia bacterium]|nr:phosphoribosylamine--glycine ligase [Clostridia bacterium]
MKLMVVGGGGREHAIIKSLKKNPDITEIFALPGNGGIAADAVCVNIGAKDIDGITAFAKENKIDFAVVAPDDPLVLGCVDALEAIGVPCFGPRANAAIIEGSKVFSKNLMKKYHIPTASYEVFDDIGAALAYAEHCPIPIVVKADGLALGKGVLICETREDVRAALHSMMEDKIFGASGCTVVMEEFLTGPEVSVLAFTDGNVVRPMISSMDHKRAHDHDEGLNTGGMGTVAPNPYYTKEIAELCMETIFLPTIAAMNAEGRTFRGCLYFGLMLTKDGPRVIEYNCRFGDPETQVVLPLLKSDLFTIMKAVHDGTLSDTDVTFSDGAACCVVCASDGYPGKYETGYPLTLPKTAEDEAIYVAGAKIKDGMLVTGGGRVLGAVAVRDTLSDAIAAAYAVADGVQFENKYMRRDIGQRALAAANVAAANKIY